MNKKNSMETKTNNTGKIIAAVAVGAVVGAALGILFAPDKGSVTRHKIAGGAKDLASDLKNKMTKKMEELDGVVASKS
jgi:gas vesicle protein